MLRLLAGVYHPTSGRSAVEGKVSSLFELALGFEMEASGWKNIRFRGYLQGESRDGIRRKASEIAEFSGLGDFLKIPARYYSAGMMVRLAFSTATAIEPEILLVDEILGAGDLAFQHKAKQRLSEMMEQGAHFGGRKSRFEGSASAVRSPAFGWTRAASGRTGRLRRSWPLTSSR